MEGIQQGSSWVKLAPQGHVVRKALRDKEEKRVYWVRQGHLASLVLLVQMVPQAQKDHRDLRVLQDHLAHQVHRAPTDLKAAQALLAFEDKWETLEFLVSKEKRAPKENLVHMAHRVQLDLVLREIVAFQVLMACRDPRELKVSVVRQGLRARKEARGILAALVSPASQVPGGTPENPEKLATRASQGRGELLVKMGKLAQPVQLAPMGRQEKEENRDLLALQDFRACPVLQVLRGKGGSREIRVNVAILEKGGTPGHPVFWGKRGWLAGRAQMAPRAIQVPPELLEIKGRQVFKVCLEKGALLAPLVPKETGAVWEKRDLKVQLVMTAQEVSQVRWVRSALQALLVKRALVVKTAQLAQLVLLALRVLQDSRDLLEELDPQDQLVQMAHQVQLELQARGASWVCQVNEERGGCLGCPVLRDLLAMMVLQDEMELLENGVIVGNRGQLGFRVPSVVRELQDRLGLQAIQDKEVNQDLGVHRVLLVVLENVVCRVLKALRETKVTMEIEVTEGRKVTEVSLAFKVSPDLPVLLVNKAVLGFQVPLALEAPLVQLDLQVKKGILDPLGQLDLLVSEEPWENQDLRAPQENRVPQAPRALPATSQPPLVTLWDITMTALLTHFRNSLKMKLP
ncbi:UNVERIFIED_CONTAM: hypothetical protein K2H54_050303 [Gekko kuhli]